MQALVLKIVSHCLGVYKVNAWLLYKRQCKQIHATRKKELALLDFINQVYEPLLQ